MLPLQVMGRTPVNMTELFAAALRAGGLTDAVWTAHSSHGTFKNAQRRFAAHVKEQGPFSTTALVARTPPKGQPSDRHG